MTRTQADREFDWEIGRQLERKDAEIERLRAALGPLLSMVANAQTIDDVLRSWAYAQAQHTYAYEQNARGDTHGD